MDPDGLTSGCTVCSADEDWLLVLRARGAGAHAGRLAAQVMGARPIHERAAEIQGQLGLGGRHSAAAICAMARQELGMPEAPQHLRLVDNLKEIEEQLQSQQPPEDVPPQKRAAGAEITSLVDQAERRSGGAGAHEMLRGGGGGATAKVKPPAPLCTFGALLKLLIGMLAIVFVAMVTVGVLATQASSPASCSLVSVVDGSDGSDGSGANADPCCLRSSWNDLISATHSCGAMTLIESGIILVLVSVHICWIKLAHGCDRCTSNRECTGIAAICAACGFAIPVLVNLGEMWASATDLSAVCDGNDDLGKIKGVIWSLTIVHSVVALTAVFGRCVFELCIKPAMLKKAKTQNPLTRPQTPRPFIDKGARSLFFN